MARKNEAKTDILNYAALRTQLRDGKLSSLYVLFGEENFLVERLVSGLQEKALGQMVSDFDKVVFDSDGNSAKLDLNRLKAEIQTPAFLSDRKFILVKNSGLFTSAAIGKKGSSDNARSDESAQEEDDDQNTLPDDLNGATHKDRQQAMISLLDLLHNQVCLVFVEQKVDKRQKNLLKAIAQAGVLAEIATENAAVLKQWVEAECKRREILISREASESLVDRCENSMRVIWSELEKLFLYLGYTGRNEIDLDTVKEVSLPDLRGNIFDLTDAISKGRTEQALLLLDTLIRQRQPLQLVQFMLARHFRQLICASELGRQDQVISKLKVMPFVASRLLQQARQFSMPVMERIYELCFESDLLVKTGQMTDRLVLETLLVRAGEAAKLSARH